MKRYTFKFELRHANGQVEYKPVTVDAETEDDALTLAAQQLEQGKTAEDEYTFIYLQKFTVENNPGADVSQAERERVEKEQAEQLERERVEKERVEQEAPASNVADAVEPVKPSAEEQGGEA